MINVIDTLPQIGFLFDNGKFNIDKWKTYINGIYENGSHIFLADLEEYTAGGKYTYERDFLPIINAVYDNSELSVLHESFKSVTESLNEKIYNRFGRELDVDIVLYLGLCNGAGWVTRINGRNTVLLGIEKILELKWFDLDSMRGLVLHELGHVYQMQYGILERDISDMRLEFVWQLFTEGVAMYFEQSIVGNMEYYHQDINGWKLWCDGRFSQIKADFNSDLGTMTRLTQRYFGDWTDYYGKGDVGYYLGARFVHYLLEKLKFDEIIKYDADLVYELYLEFINE